MPTKQEIADRKKLEAERGGQAPTKATKLPPKRRKTKAPAKAAAPVFGAGLSADFDWAAVRSYVDFARVVRERFPSWAWALEHPQLGPLLREAAATQDWSLDIFDSKLRRTQWWQERTAAQRTYDVGQETQGDADKAKALADAKTAVSKEASVLGVSLTDEQLNDLATRSLRNAWNSDELLGVLAEMSPTGAGDITASVTAINSVAADYMVKIDPTTASDLARRLITGEMSRSGLNEYMKNIARQQFPDPQIVEQLNNGVTMKQYFQPHRQIIADALEMSVNSVDLTNSRFRPIMSIRDGDTTAPMTLGQTERFAKTLDEYWQTRNGRAEKASTGRAFLQGMGIIA